jgi:hypothetical protein
MFAGDRGQRGRRLAWRGGRDRAGAGSVAGMRAADTRSCLPAKMLVGVPAMMATASPCTRHSEPAALVLQVPRGQAPADAP